jgi:hypothetical protein
MSTEATAVSKPKKEIKLTLAQARLIYKTLGAIYTNSMPDVEAVEVMKVYNYLEKELEG